MSSSAQEPTPPDLVVLSLLSYAPLHGYALNQELTRRRVKDWAGISPAQVYYSLRKLHDKGWTRLRRSAEAARGPDRETYEVTKEGRAVLKRALGREEWATQRPPNPFQTWMALSHNADLRLRRRVVEARRRFLVGEIDRDERTLAAIKAETGTEDSAAYQMVTLMIRQFQTELAWLADIDKALIG